MPHPFQSTEKLTTSSDSLDQPIASISVSDLSEDEQFDGQEQHASQRRPRTDNFDPLNDVYHQRSRDSSWNRSKSVLSRPSQMHLLPELESSPPSTALDKKEVAVTLSLSPYGVPAAPSTPQHSRSRRLQRLWLHWFTAYRLLIGLTFVVNLAVLIVFNHTNRPLSGSLIATATNFFVAVLVRQEELINSSFSFVAKSPSTLPLAVRKILADFHHYGGVHIGCAISALMWYCLFAAVSTMFCIKQFREGMMTGWLWADIVTCYAFLLFILFICITAHPHLRIKFHNTFEHTHRFAGWAALLVLWVHAGVASKAEENGTPFYANPAIWLLAASTFLIILPWLRIRRVPIQAEAVSSREVKLTFPYATMPYTSTTRFSTSPLMEWHAFATIPSADGSTAQIIISQAGDWTKSIIENPPKEIWIRKPAAKNFLSFTPLFNSVLLVATGAGIGPMLSLLSSPAIAHMKAQGRQVRVMWCVYAPEAPHWAFVQDIIRAVDPMPKIFDSREFRPDLPFEANYMAQVCDIEAVMVVSNKTVTQNVVAEVKAHGRAAYGAVFDS